MEWDNEKCLQLIEFYKLKPEIWQSTHKFHYNKNKKQDAWNEIAKYMGTTIDIVKLKMNSLLSSFWRERAKEGKSIGTGKGRDEVHWFGYKSFEFIMDKNKCKKTLDTAQKKNNEETDKNEVTENITDAEEEIVTEDDCHDTTEANVFSESVQNSSQESTDNIVLQVKPTQAPKSIPPKTRKRKVENTSDSHIDEAFDMLQRCVQRDACEVYGEHIAAKLRTYSARTQSVVQHLFSDILFNADMGQFDENMNSGPPSDIYRNNARVASTCSRQSRHIYMFFPTTITK